MPHKEDANLQTQDKVHVHPQYVSLHVVEEYDPTNGRFIRQEVKVLYAGDKEQSVDKIPNRVRFWPLDSEKKESESWVRLAVVARARYPRLMKMSSMIPACAVLVSVGLGLSFVASVCVESVMDVPLLISMWGSNFKVPWFYAKFDSKLYERLWNIAVPMTYLKC